VSEEEEEEEEEELFVLSSSSSSSPSKSFLDLFLVRFVEDSELLVISFTLL
tara:strand:+ start:371 stop:523 length:153 start_codon:yes stop_codon:yes gene_type:complete